MTLVSQNYEMKNRDTYSLVSFAGELDAHMVETLGPALQAQIAADCRALIIDVQKVSFIDSHGVGLFVSLLKRMHRHQGRLLISGADGQPASVLRMVGLNRDLVTYCVDKEAAIAEVARAS